MKNLLTLLAIVLTFQCVAQRTDYPNIRQFDPPFMDDPVVYIKIFVHESNIHKIHDELTVGNMDEENSLIWDKQGESEGVTSFDRLTDTPYKLKCDTIKLVPFQDQFILYHDNYGEMLSTQQLSEMGYKFSHRWVVSSDPFVTEYYWVKNPNNIIGSYNWLKENK